MGMKGKSGLAFCVPFLVLSVSMSSSVWAQEGMCVMPTGSGQELAYPENWNSPIVLNLHVDGLEDGAIPSGGCAVVKVDSGGWGKPPYAWEILGGESFYFNIGGVHTQTTQTPGDYQAVQLCINSESCGTAEPYGLVMTMGRRTYTMSRVVQEGGPGSANSLIDVQCRATHVRAAIGTVVQTMQWIAATIIPSRR